MVSHRDLVMYLVAVKSFYHRVGEGEIVIMDDGTLTDSDRELLSGHLGQPHFLHVNQADTGSFPRGGCWERLVSIVAMLEDYYVVQLDSDTLTRSALPEVLDCIQTNKSFTLGTQNGRQFVTLDQASNVARNFQGEHVQTAAEKNLFWLPNAARRKYVRGSAGFAGFARGSDIRTMARDFSQSMSQLLGKKWMEWGSEQVTSNYLVANSPAAIVLPYPKYSCFDLNLTWQAASFLHFIGTHRFARGVYARASRAAIERNFS